MARVKHLGMVGRVKGEGLGYRRRIAYHGPVSYRAPASGGQGGMAPRGSDGRVRRWVLGPDIDRGSRSNAADRPHREYWGWQGGERAKRDTDKI
jgi:hypothetical protein